ncbi:MAG: hypothetical protein R3291_01565 [Thermoplasmata archaeon]|nr:hypothetical protein [Thermoplasmata archaeon]
MRPRWWTVLWVIAVAALLVVLVLQLSGILTLADLAANPVLFLVAFVIVAVLSAVGAMFIGVLVTHRIFASAEFTPFEQEMLRMREEVREIRARLEEVAGDNPGKGKD